MLPQRELQILWRCFSCSSCGLRIIAQLTKRKRQTRNPVTLLTDKDKSDFETILLKNATTVVCQSGVIKSLHRHCTKQGYLQLLPLTVLTPNVGPRKDGSNSSFYSQNADRII